MSINESQIKSYVDVPENFDYALHIKVGSRDVAKNVYKYNKEDSVLFTRAVGVGALGVVDDMNIIYHVERNGRECRYIQPVDKNRAADSTSIFYATNEFQYIIKKTGKYEYCLPQFLHTTIQIYLLFRPLWIQMDLLY